MPWFKVDDGFHDHRKVLRMIERTADPLKALGLWLVAASWSADNLEDGFVPGFLLRRWGATTADADALVAAKLWTTATGREGDEGYQFHDWADYNPLREDVEAQREYDKRRRALTRDHALLAKIKARDGDRCRYCGSQVNFSDRRSATGGTYDHIDPAGPNNERNVVVACRGCNSAKGNRTLEEWGRRLLRPGSTTGPSEVGLRVVPQSGAGGQKVQGGHPGRVSGPGTGHGSGPVTDLDPQSPKSESDLDRSDSDLDLSQNAAGSEVS